MARTHRPLDPSAVRVIARVSLAVLALLALLGLAVACWWSPLVPGAAASLEPARAVQRDELPAIDAGRDEAPRARLTSASVRVASDRPRGEPSERPSGSSWAGPPPTAPAPAWPVIPARRARFVVAWRPTSALVLAPSLRDGELPSPRAPPGLRAS